MYLNTHNPNECCGCSACESVCPKKCIKMDESTDGFLYPVVDENKCIHCEMCKRVCPFEDHPTKEQKDICFYGWHRDDEIRKQSTSGAAFIGIVQVFRDRGYSHFYGAAYDDNMCVHHIDVNYEEIKQLRCSKYVQSRMEQCYLEIKNNLKNGEKVLFSGTPCQVDGLIKFLRGKYIDNLFTVALVCHGVSSPKAFKKYISEVENESHAKVNMIRFRDKRLLDGKLSHRFTTLKMSDGKVLASTDNIYTTAFGIGIMDRESCYFCPYSSPSGAGDITIGDFWGLEKNIHGIEDEISKGISLLIPHSDKADSIMDQLKIYMELHEVPLSYAVNDRQRQLIRPIERPKARDYFLDDVLNKGKSFHAEAKKAILRWKIHGYAIRINRKLRKIFRQ